jgi:hypothetical protein
MAGELSGVAAAARRAGTSLGRWLAILAGLAALLFAVYTWLALGFDYSSGERAGLLQKFSLRGWVCKTYEGELAMYVVAGVQPEVWPFSVRDPAIAEQLQRTVGRRVQLHYTEHPPFHSCFGDTRYFVDRVTPIDDLTQGVAPAGATAPPR